MPDVTTPVLVVGAGPAGLATSLSLSRHGVPHLLVEKHPGTAHSPRAHIVNQRTVEICRDLGIEDRLLDVATPAELMSNNVWATSLAGRELARLETWGTSAARAADYRAASPSPMCNCPQHVLGPVLHEAIEEAGSARSASATSSCRWSRTPTASRRSSAIGTPSATSRCARSTSWAPTAAAAASSS